MLDQNLKQYATSKQWEKMEAIDEHGTISSAARALGVNRSNVSRAKDSVHLNAAKAGYAPEYDMTHQVPQGFKVSGVSTLYGEDGQAKIQWVKSSADKVVQEAAILAMIEGMKDDIIPELPVIAPIDHSGDLMTLYPVGDHHFGMLAWDVETGGDDYDLPEGERLLCGAMKHLVDISPTGDAAIMLMGDFLHYDGFMAVTPESRHLLDADSRFPKMVRVAIKSVRYIVREALKKHLNVRLIVEIGNHDTSSAIWLMELFSALYEGDERIIVDNSPRPFHCFTWGKNMVGTHHGHKVKMDSLPLLFATDWPKEWGATENRVIFTGHIHHQSIKEFVGASVESLAILAPKDAYAANNGYRAMQSMKSIVLHKVFGEVARNTVTPAMLK